MDGRRTSDRTVGATPFRLTVVSPGVDAFMETEPERERERQTYQLCRIGFGLTALALVIACFTSFLTLPMHFGGRPFLPWVFHTPLWHWIDSPVIWASLIGTYFLWGRWNDPGWQRRAGLLLVMCMADAILWFLSHGSDLGLRLDDVGHQWFRDHLGQALGWAEFALIASLSCDVMVHLGVEQAAETGRATRSLAATGAAVWMALFLLQTNWKRGWPLVPRNRIPLFEGLLLELGWNMIWAVTLIQVTALTVAAAKQCSVVLAEMAHEDGQFDVFKSPSEDEFEVTTGAGSGRREN
jgi:hypothetical protein